MQSLSNVQRQVIDKQPHQQGVYDQILAPLKKDTFDLQYLQNVIQRCQGNKILLYKKLDSILSKICKNSIDKNSQDQFLLQDNDIKSIDFLLKNAFHCDWNEVKIFFESCKVPNPSEHPSIKIMLAYREKVVNDILNEVKKDLPKEIFDEKKQFLQEKIISTTHPLYQKFLDNRNIELSWSDNGSKDPTSDIDVMLRGDYTQLAVKLFNQKMSTRFDHIEPGVSLDANVYSEYGVPEILRTDFSSNLRDLFLETKGINVEVAELTKEKILKSNPKLLKEYNHFLQEIKQKPSFQKYIDIYAPKFKAVRDKIEFIKDPHLKIKNVNNFEVASLLKIRRYMTQAEWNQFSSLVISIFEKNKLNPSQIKQNLHQAEFKFYQNIQELTARIIDFQEELKSQAFVDYDLSKHVHPSERNLVAEKNEKNVSFLQIIPENLKMKLENRLYEEKLRKVAKQIMMIELYDLNHIRKENDSNRDKLLLELEKLHCEAKYFANEAYVTTASLVSVVINKQMLSRGLDSMKLARDKFKKIPLDANEHLISLNEQLGEFFKESTRSLKPNSQYGVEEAVGIKSAKYIHRYTSSYSHLYEALHLKSKMLLNENQIKAATMLETLKKDPRSIEQKSSEIRTCINLLFYQKYDNQSKKANSQESNAITPEQELTYFKKFLMKMTANTYVDLYLSRK